MIRSCPNCKVKPRSKDVTRKPCQVHCPNCGMEGPIGSNGTMAKAHWNELPRMAWRPIEEMPDLPDGTLLVLTGDLEDVLVFTYEDYFKDVYGECVEINNFVSFFILPEAKDNEIPDPDEPDEPVDPHSDVINAGGDEPCG